MSASDTRDEDTERATGAASPPGAAELLDGSGIAVRHPIESDHARVVAVVDHWFGRAARRLVPRLWFRHFTTTSWLAEGASGELLGFLVGFVSPDDPGEAVVVLLGVEPNHRRRGIGRALVERFAAGALSAGAHRASTITWPDEPRAIRFLQAVGFRPDEKRATQRLYGVPSVPDYEDDREDRAPFVRDLG